MVRALGRTNELRRGERGVVFNRTVPAPEAASARSL
jgi:hypothetical protein